MTFKLKILAKILLDVICAHTVDFHMPGNNYITGLGKHFLVSQVNSNARNEAAKLFITKLG